MFYIHSKVHHLRCFENTIYGDLNTDRKGGTSLTTISHSIIRVSRRWVTPVYLRVNPWPRLSRVSYAELTVAPSPTRAVVNVGWRAPISRSGNYWPAPIECPLMLLRTRRSFFRCHEACTRAICILRALCAGDGTVGHTYIPFPRETPIPSAFWRVAGYVFYASSAYGRVSGKRAAYRANESWLPMKRDGFTRF